MPPAIDAKQTKQLIKQCLDASEYRMLKTLPQDIATALNFQERQADTLKKAAQEIAKLLEQIQTLENELAAAKTARWTLRNLWRKA